MHLTEMLIFTASLQKDINLEAMLAVLQTSCAVSEEQSEVFTCLLCIKMYMQQVLRGNNKN